MNLAVPVVSDLEYTNLKSYFRNNDGKLKNNNPIFGTTLYLGTSFE